MFDAIWRTQPICGPVRHLCFAMVESCALPCIECDRRNDPSCEACQTIPAARRLAGASAMLTKQASQFADVRMIQLTANAMPQFAVELEVHTIFAVRC